MPGVDDEYTKSLLHFNNSWNDESGKIWSVGAGSPTFDTVNKKYGAAAADMPGGGAYIYTAAHADHKFGTGDLTIEFWTMFTATTGIPFCNLDSVNLYGSSTIFFQIVDSGKLRWHPSYDGTHYITTSGVINDGQWHHIAAVRYGQDFYFALDGYKQGEILSWNPTIDGTNNILVIGRDQAGTGSWYWEGKMDELRISKAIARFTTFPFAPPTGEYGPPWVQSKSSALILF